MLFCFLVFFFFKQKTAYEMRISDWSSDVCSSDLHARGETVIYEAHLKGLTRARDCFPAHDRGTFGALGHAKNIEYLQRLGITTIELLPIHAFVRDRHLVEQGLTNY